MKQLYSLFLTIIKYDTSGLNLQVFVETNKTLSCLYIQFVLQIPKGLIDGLEYNQEDQGHGQAHNSNEVNGKQELSQA
jgi:hypothetical protein